MEKLIVIVDNFRWDENFDTDWGFSVFIDDGVRILFDLGNKPSIFERNLGALGIDLRNVDYLVISHSDYDHIGGLEVFIRKNRKAKVFLPEGAAGELISKLKAHGYEIILATNPQVVYGRFYTTGSVTPSSRAEQSIFFRSDDYVYVIAGCSHPGVCNIVKRVCAFHKDKNLPVFYIGGLHLYKLKGDVLYKKISEIRECGVRKIAPSHCTGELAVKEFEKLYKERFLKLGVGKVLEFV